MRVWGGAKWHERHASSERFCTVAERIREFEPASRRTERFEASWTGEKAMAFKVRYIEAPVPVSRRGVA